MKKIFVIVMAAGKGTRIGATDRPKVMFELNGKPIIDYAIAPLLKLKADGLIDRIITIVGFLGDRVIDYLGDKSEFVWQNEQLGTGHAVQQAENLISGEDGFTLIVNGDHALYSAETYRKMVEMAQAKSLTLGFATVKTKELFDDYGRVLRDENNKILKVVERPDASDEEIKIAEKSINLFVVDNKWLFEALPKIEKRNAKNEYYIVDIVKLASDEGKTVETIEVDDINEARGINTLEDRAAVEEILNSKS